MAERAILIGAGIAGLLAARTLAEHCREVLILEHDADLSQASRTGAPQGQHLHTLLKRGQDLLAELFPGFDDDLAQAGSPQLDWGRDTEWLNPYGWTPRFESEVRTRSCSRPLLESLIRRRVLAIPNVRLIGGARVEDLLTKQNRISGVRAGGESYPADLVVDASGRQAFTEQWLARRGQAPPVQSLDIRLGYASRRYRLHDAAGLGWRQLYVQISPPQFQRGGVICPVENGEFVATLIGANGDCPPRDEAAFLAFARGLRSPRLYEALAAAEPLTPIHLFRKTGNRRHFYHQRELPSGMVALGDSVCSLNPVYAQGMTLAILAAQALGEATARGGAGWEKNFQRRLAKSLTDPWTLATSEDAKFLSARRPLAQRYFAKVLAHSVRHPPTHHRFLRVLHMLDHPYALLDPRVAFPVLRA